MILLKSEGQRQSSKPFDLKAFGKMAFGLQSAKNQTDIWCRGQLSITKMSWKPNVFWPNVFWPNVLWPQMSDRQMTFGQMSVSQISGSQISSDQMSVSQRSVTQRSVTQRSVTQRSVRLFVYQPNVFRSNCFWPKGTERKEWVTFTTFSVQLSVAK